jgi:glutathione-specific gamma-glutamylcyclotransferase
MNPLARPPDHPHTPVALAYLAHIERQWLAQRGDLWIFGYASLIWRPEFEWTERRAAKAFGWHRALQMWSTINRGSPECPGLVFALLRGGSCQGVAFRIPKALAAQSLRAIWQREMPGDVYEPRWLTCHTPQGPIQALAFTLPHSSPSYSGVLSDAQYRHIFQTACGRYGTTLDYAQRTDEGLREEGIEDPALKQLLRLT